jgi:hypothetical protein
MSVAWPKAADLGIAASRHYPGYTGRQAAVVGKAAHDSERTVAAQKPRSLDHDIGLRARNRQHFYIERLRSFYIKGKYELG